MTDRRPPAELLAQFEPLSTLSLTRRAELASRSLLQAVSAGSVVAREGERDNQSLYLAHGIVSLNNDRLGHLRDLRASDSRHPIADRQPRPVTIIAVTDCEVVRIDNDVLDTTLAWNDLSGGPSQDGAWMGEFRDSLVFRELPPGRLAELAPKFERLPVKAGNVVINEGDSGDFYYVIESGEATVARRGQSGVTRVIAEIGPGSAFGEEALVSGARRNATVAMKTAGVLRRLAKADFDQLLRAPLLKGLSYEEATQRVASGARWLDVRHEIEYRHVHVPGALLFPLHRLRDSTEELDRKLEYICYCRTGRRSAAAAFLLAQRGFRSAMLVNGFEALPVYEAN